MARRLKGQCPNPLCKKDLGRVKTSPHCDSPTCPWDVCTCKAVIQAGSFHWYHGGSAFSPPRPPEG